MEENKMPLLTVSNVTKIYNEYKALDDVSFNIGAGITALLGNNGAGKTTLINGIVGLIEVNQGTFLLNEIDNAKESKEFRRHLGFLPQECGYYDEFTALQFLRYMGAVKNVPRKKCEEVIEKYMTRLKLWEHRNKKISKYSGGMKHRLGIIQAMLNEPMLLILDEPTTGLDYVERGIFSDMMREYAKEHIVIISTHIFSDVENIAENVLILDAGKLVCNEKFEKGASIIEKYKKYFEG
jgi:ABC-2 type transport system ATP-binding protein